MVDFRNTQKRKATFDFLGFTFYWGKSRSGIITPKVKTSKQRLRSKVKKMKEWIKGKRNEMPLKDIWDEFKRKVEGHIRYYGVSFNISEVSTYVYIVTKVIFKWLNRRSQRKSFDWERFRLFVQANPLPQIKVHHKLF